MEGVDLITLRDARKFVRSSDFEVVCAHAGWGYEWVRDLMTAVDRLPEGVRGAIVSDCVRMLKALSCLD